MFWSAPKKKKDDDKERQIKELKQVFPSIRRPNNDDNLFEIKFVVNNQYSSLRVFIPSDFPNTRPVLQASGPITHPWLDQFKQVNGSEKLMQWTRNSSLVEVVEESLSALLTGSNEGESSSSSRSSYSAAATPLTAQPTVARASPSADASVYPAYGTSSVAQPARSPYDTAYAVAAGASTVYPAVATPANYAPSPTAASSSASARPPLPTPSPAPASQTGSTQRQVSGALPSLPSSFPELEQLTTIQLQRLLNDEVALEAHLGEVESIKQMQVVIQQMKDSNEQHARRNLQKENELEAAVEEVETLQSQLKVLVHEYREKLEAAKKKHETPMDTILKELKAKKNELDEKSEELGAAFVEGKMELAQFLTDFLDQRAQYHELAAKLKILGK